MSRFSYFVRETLISLRRNLLMTLAGIITVTVSLTLLGGAWLVWRLVDHGTARWKDGVEFEIFMNVDATEQQVADVREALQTDEEVEDFRFLTKADAYEEFERIFADQPELVESTTPEALPESFRVAPISAELTQEVAARYEARPGVKKINTAQKIVDRIIDVTDKIRLTFIVLAVALFASSVFLIMNTIRLATYARRREIEVMKLVGASNSFVRIPFVSEGLLQGAIGAGLAIGLIAGLEVLLSNFVRDRAGYWSGFTVGMDDVRFIAFFVFLIGAGIGMLGSAIGLRRFLDV